MEQSGDTRSIARVKDPAFMKQMSQKVKVGKLSNYDGIDLLVRINQKGNTNEDN